MRRRRRGTGAGGPVPIRGLAAALLLVGCSEQKSNPECALATEALEAIDASSIAIELRGGDAKVRAAADDLSRYLGRMWGTAPPIVEDGSSFSFVIALSIDPMRADGYALKRDAQAIRVSAADDSNLAFGIYGLLEELGARFFHPLDEYVPELGGAHVPRVLDRSLTPAFAVRGIHLHLLHPIEWFDAFNGSTEQDLAEAKRFIDWLVKTGQNHVQWPILRTMDLPAWEPHAKKIVEYAHSRGVTVGIEPLLFAASSLQNNFILATTEDWEPEMRARLELLLGIGFDQVELALGEFLSEDPARVIQMLDRVVAQTSSAGVASSVVNHVGNFPNLWVDYEGMREFFYFLPAHADPRLIQSVHTVFFYDLYRGWGAYGHDDFSMHREFLFEQLAAGRTVRYKPESAYWVSSDVDVPLFLPEYVHARWVDIHNLVRDVRERGLPSIEGHVTFSSGHEWGYWMTDYLTAKMMWEPERELTDFYGHYAAAFGTCAPEVQAELTRFSELQSEHLFDRRLIPYLSGDDFHDDLGATAGFVTIPARVPFQDVLALPPEERAAFHEDVVEGLRAFDAENESVEANVRAVCERATGSMLPWCKELLDGIAVVRLRARHAASLYEAVELARRSPEEANALLSEAGALVDQASAVIAERESAYRFDAERLTGAKENPTIYRYGYLRQAHLACYWRRQALQAEHLVATFEPALISDLPQCLE
jgi:hypothetical protein